MTRYSTDASKPCMSNIQLSHIRENLVQLKQAHHPSNASRECVFKSTTLCTSNKIAAIWRYLLFTTSNHFTSFKLHLKAHPHLVRMRLNLNTWCKSARSSPELDLNEYKIYFTSLRLPPAKIAGHIISLDIKIRHASYAWQLQPIMRGTVHEHPTHHTTIKSADATHTTCMHVRALHVLHTFNRY
jgi:hypothetical protein